MRRSLERAKRYYRLRGGTYVYVGDRMVSALPETKQKTARRRLALLAFGTAGCVLAAGSVPAPGMQQGPAVIPFYLGEVCAAVRLAWAAFGLMREDWKCIRGYRFADTLGILPPAGGAVALFAAAAGAGGALHLLRHGLEGSLTAPDAALFFLLQILAAALALFLRKTACALPWEKTDGSPDPAGHGDPSGGSA